MSNQKEMLATSVSFAVGTKIPSRIKCSLRQPVVARVESTKDGIILSSELFDEEAFGSTYSAAEIEFLVSLCDRFQSLAKRENHLSAQDRAILNELRSVLQIRPSYLLLF